MARILLVDDSRFLLKVLTIFLKGDGHDIVATGENGHDGIALHSQHRPELTLLDITMPGMDGRSCLQEILEADPDARVIMVSAVKVREIIVECLTAGAKGYVEKPFNLHDPAFCDKFRNTIREALTP